MYYQTDFNFPGNSTNIPPPSTDLGSIFQINLPIGTILMYGGTTLPSNYLWCDGVEYSAALYSQLYAVIGETYGSSAPTISFIVPNMQKRIPIGSNPTNPMGISYPGQPSPTQAGSLFISVNQLAQHQHLYPNVTQATGYVTFTSGPVGTRFTTQNNGNYYFNSEEPNSYTGGIAEATPGQEYLPPVTVVNFIIKYI